MKTNFESIRDRKLYLWGNGKALRRYWNQIPENLNISGILDKDRVGATGLEKNNSFIDCYYPESINNIENVIICVENPSAIQEISKELDEKEIKWCHLYEMVDYYFKQSNQLFETSPSNQDEVKIVKFIDTIIPVDFCNLKCSYCYLSQKEVSLKHYTNVFHSAEYIRFALSRKRLGGVAFINLCGVGETLLLRELPYIVKALTDEGHYIQIVSNMTITRSVEKLLKTGIKPDHLFLKCSLHYLELKNKKLLDVFAENVAAAKNKGVSFTIEMVPTDDLVPCIDEIKKYCLDNFGALPHITTARDESKENFELLTNFTEDKYEEIWSTFESEMFKFKFNEYREAKEKKHRYSNCMAGAWAGELNLATGDLFSCVNNPYLYNIYENPDEDIPWKAIGDNCCMPYCFNGHAYLTFGLVQDIVAPTYCDMRDRITISGEHWVGDKLRKVFSQKLYENNSLPE